ncbi:MAG: hypothetical protein K9N35_07430 [Candidatus Marinimicrobia bacterium]|nr:hypothetical protein [Candidatus Neomarinimicrobiota bacterium]
MQEPEQHALPLFIIDGPPWEKKHDIGFFVAFVETIKAFLLRPAKTFSVIRRVAGISDALVYTVGIQVFTFLWTFAMSGADPGMLLPQNPAILEMLELPENFSQIMVLIYPFSIILLQFIAAYALHIALRWRGLQLYDFNLIFRILAYSGGTAALLLIIPIIGGMTSIMMTIYLAYVGLRTIYGIEFGSFLLTALLALLIAIGLYLLSAVSITIIVLLFAILI